MKIRQLIYTAIFCVTGLACCQSNQKHPSKTVERMPNSLLNNLTKAERDPQMMFYLEQSVDGESVGEVLNNSETVIIDFIKAIPEEKMSYRYDFGKWTVAEVLQHIISYEKIMTESALKIAAKPVEKPFGNYTQSSTASSGKGATKKEMLERFKQMRKKTIETFESFTESEFQVMGIHEWFPSSPRSLALCISGHQQHHSGVIEKKYLE